jgi:hypothetical protein
VAPAAGAAAIRGDSAAALRYTLAAGPFAAAGRPEVSAMADSRPGAAAGAAFGLALLFATGGFGFVLVMQAARLGVEAPAPRQRAPEVIPEAAPEGARPAEPAQAPAPHERPRAGAADEERGPGGWEGE